MKFLDLFAGIGGFRHAFEKAGHECVGYAEIDKFARKSYEAMYNTEGEWTAHDITKVTDEEWSALRGAVDVICGGFPCQAFSVAGARRGFDDTRGTLFFEIARATKQIQPRYLVLENVKGLLSHEQGQTYATIISALDELGYDTERQTLNSKDFGVPQNRERVFIIGHLRGASRREIFPLTRNGREVYTKSEIKKLGNIRKNGKSQSGDVFDASGLCPTLCATTTQKDAPKIAIFDDQGRTNKKHKLKDICPTLRAEMHGNVPKIVNIFQRPRGNNESGHISMHNYDLRMRKLTPRECWRLQSFPDELFEKASKVNSDSQLYKQAGNSVTVNVVYEIAKKLKEVN